MKSKQTSAAGNTSVSGCSADELLLWMQAQPRTFGWDAIIAFNRGRANALLLQQYLTKLTTANYLKPIEGEIGGDNGTSEHLFGIRHGVPVLSFHKAYLDSARIRLTLPVASGLSINISSPVGGIRSVAGIQRPITTAAPKLWLDLELTAAPASINDAGEVALELKNFSALDTDLLSDALGKFNAVKFFRERFSEWTDQGKYVLGVLDKNADSTLAPQSLRILTQSSPDATRLSAPSYGDGAVLLFVTLKGGTDGILPGVYNDFKYLIPNDGGGTQYSAAVVLSNRVLFGTLIKKSS